MNDDRIRHIINDYDKTTTFVTSKSAGLGKTHYIRSFAMETKKRIVYFPIAGTIDLNDIGKRLQEIDFSKDSILAIQVSFVDKMDLLNEILVNLALFRFFISSNHIIVIPHNSC
jgi:hypothetical protein